MPIPSSVSGVMFLTTKLFLIESQWPLGIREEGGQAPPAVYRSWSCVGPAAPRSSVSSLWGGPV